MTGFDKRESRESAVQSCRMVRAGQRPGLCLELGSWGAGVLGGPKAEGDWGMFPRSHFNVSSAVWAAASCTLPTVGLPCQAGPSPFLLEQILCCFLFIGDFGHQLKLSISFWKWSSVLFMWRDGGVWKESHGRAQFKELYTMDLVTWKLKAWKFSLSCV